MNDSLTEILRLVAAGIVGGLIASFATHRFTLNREQASGIRNRRREFRAFITQFRSEAADRHHFPHEFAQFYQNKIPNLRHAASTIADDFPRTQRAEFDRLISIAAGFPEAPADSERSKKRAIESLDAILGFLDDA